MAFQPQPLTEVRQAHCEVCPIKKLAFCGRLDSDTQAALYRVSQQIKLAPHYHIFQEDEPADSAFQLLEGAAKAYKVLPDGRVHLIGFIMPGDLVGLSGRGLWGHGIYSCSVETLVPSVVCRYPAHQLGKLSERFPDLKRSLLERTGTLLNAAQERMVLLGRRSAAERVAHFMVSLVERAESAGGPSGEAWVPARQQDIADHLGLTPETVSRVWADFRREGLIRPCDSRHIVITDRSALLTYSQP